MTKITVFTPTYNRAYILKELYKSLLIQSYKNFEWLIIDDGSIDNTKELINKFINEKKIDIQYFFKNNGGKHRAINLGTQKAIGELFFIVDSDDRIPEKSLEIIINQYEKIKNDSKIAGVVGLKCYFDKRVVGTTSTIDNLICNTIDYRVKYRIKGDRAEVFKLDILLKYPFPEYENENFIAESSVWNRIAQKYSMLYFNENIYECEYLDDGLSKKSIQLRMKNPNGTILIYKEIVQNSNYLFERIKAVINFWRFSFNSNKSFMSKLNMLVSKWCILFVPVGYGLYLLDKRKLLV